jgi:DNA-binding Xre family transcriptional regulator
VAEATGIYPGTVRKLKQGKRPNIRWPTLKAVAEYLIANGGLEPCPQPEGAAK